MADRPTGTVAFMFTDLVGSTRLWEDEQAAMTNALAQHDRIIRAEIEAHRGYVFSTAGDAFGVAFDTCESAAAAAARLHERLAGADWPTSAPLRIRVGLHVGAADERDGDYFGPVLNRAARIMAVANGGQTLASAAFHDLVVGRDDAVVDLGEHRLKDLGAPERLWQLGTGEFPPLATLSISRHNLPVERTPLVGRKDDVEEIVRLARRSRLVSVVGIGGTGKTRVASAVAAELASELGDGAWFVDLVAVRTSDDVATAIASAVGVSLIGDHPAVALAAALGSKQALIVLDNCEHMTGEVSRVVDLVLGSTSATRFVATSREPLDLVDETLFQLAPLPTKSVEGRAPAIELFEDAARRAGRVIHREDAAAIADVCERLDGHPLSIELAAAQLRSLSPEQLRSRLGDRFELLARRRSVGRHASLLAVLEDTWMLLDSAEQTMLLQLAAFPSGFDLDGVEAVCSDLDVGLAGRTLGGLVDRSLVVPSAGDRFRLLESVKEFCRRRWFDDAPLHRHQRWVLSWFETRSREDGVVDLDVYVWVVDHLDDWRQAEERFRADGDWGGVRVLLLGSLACFHGAFLGPDALAMGRRLRRDLAGGAIDPEPRVAIELALASLGLPARRPDWIAEHAATAVEMLRTDVDDPPALSLALVLASWMTALRDVDAALALLDEAFGLAEGVGAHRIADIVLGYRANHLALVGRDVEARHVLELLGARTEMGEQTIGRSLWLFVTMALSIVRDPGASVSAAEALVERDVQAPWGLIAASFAATDDVHATIEFWDRMLEMAERWFVDDGLPDLLLPPAVLAYARGDHDRCRVLITAIRRFGRPTQDFLTTIMYRQLRAEIGLSDDNPLNSMTAADLLAESDAWMRSLAAVDVSSESG